MSRPILRTSFASCLISPPICFSLLTRYSYLRVYFALNFGDGVKCWTIDHNRPNQPTNLSVPPGFPFHRAYSSPHCPIYPNICLPVILPTISNWADWPRDRQAGNSKSPPAPFACACACAGACTGAGAFSPPFRFSFLSLSLSQPRSLFTSCFDFIVSLPILLAFPILH